MVKFPDNKRIIGEGMPEQYQFLRYYIPGSLSLAYLFLLVLVNTGERIFDLLIGTGTVSVVIGTFTLSPALGYVIYQFYDTLLYNRIARCKKRKALNLLDTWADAKGFPKGDNWESTRRKELIDFILYSSATDSSFEISDQLADTIRGFWSHINARIVSSVFVPISSGILFLLLNSLRPIEINGLSTLSAVFAIIVLSIFIGYPSIRTIKEAFALEEYLIRAKERDLRDYMNLENQQDCTRLREEFRRRCRDTI